MRFRFILVGVLPLFVFIAMAEPASEAPVTHTGASHYPDHLDGAYTGGFGEPTCHTCHFDYDVNDERGSLELQGLEGQYQPGEQYEITVTVQSERLENGGFQMTARFEDGSQAGAFTWDGERLSMTPAASNDVQYVQHSRDGTRPTAEREVAWTLTWKAPESDSGPVILNIAGNAGNDDDSVFGDWIYVKELEIEPVD